MEELEALLRDNGENEDEGNEDGETGEDVSDIFDWSEDFATFSGQPESGEFLQPGPKIEGTSPLSLFLQLWDHNLMATIVTETNRYARETIAAVYEKGEEINTSLYARK